MKKILIPICLIIFAIGILFYVEITRDISFQNSEINKKLTIIKSEIENGTLYLGSESISKHGFNCEKFDSYDIGHQWISNKFKKSFEAVQVVCKADLVKIEWKKYPLFGGYNWVFVHLFFENNKTVSMEVEWLSDTL